MPLHFYSAGGALAVLQYTSPTGHNARAVRIDVDRYRRTLNSLIILIWGGVAVAAIIVHSPFGILLGIISVAVLVALIFFKPYRWLDEEAVLQNRLCRGELRDTYVTNLDPSYRVIINPKGEMLYPLEQSRPFLGASRVIELDRELREECELTSYDIRYRFALRMELITLAREAFGDWEHLDEMELAAQSEKEELYGRARKVHLMKFGLMEHMSPEEQQELRTEGRRLSRPI